MTSLPVEIFGILLLFVALVVLWGLLSPVDVLPLWSRTHDKLLHGVAFAILAVLANLWQREAHVGVLWAALVVGGVAGEVAQHFSAYRQFCWRDAVANALGVTVGLSGVQCFLGFIDVKVLLP